ncbi:MAG: lipase maturation factor family protein [Candidatus Omnitrophica bacterium]|nr:lipase maturation factor family protein [Candidatus Omnitrophota bacterium]
MEVDSVSQFWLTRFCFQRFLGFIYLIAFLVVVHQFNPLLGERGLLPVKHFLGHVKFWDAPSIFWLNSSDRFFLIVGWLGVFLSSIALFGISERFGIFFSGLIWFLLWLLYLSFVNVGQTFYSFGWETLLLETGFLAIFLGSANTAPPKMVIYLLRWVLFRVMFGAGLIKIRGDECWRDLTCMYYHYETQPIPNPLSWYFHRLAPLVHRASTAFTHFVELVVPFGVFGPRLIGYWAGGFTVAFQVLLILSGNLSWLNYVTLLLCVPCFDDAFLRRFIPINIPVTEPIAGLREGMIIALTALVILLSVQPALNLISSGQVMNTSFEPLHLVNTYGAFGSVTKKRMEIIVEGTDEKVLTESTKWREYEFRAKPGDVKRMLPIVAPYHLRLDWLMWFAAMGDYRYYPWILNLVGKFLQNDLGALSLIANNPFPDAPPKYIRARLFHYRFTDFKEKKKTGAWWVRTYSWDYLPPLSLDNASFKSVLEEQGWLEKA